jgi:hypothetical protein
MGRASLGSKQARITGRVIMATTSVRESHPRNRIQQDFSFGPTEDRRRDTLLRLSWVNIVAAFKCRPSPRGPWDETATGDQTPWKYVVGPIRTAIAAAVFNGDQRVIDETLGAARAFCRELEADFTSMVPAREEESTVSLALEETHVEGPANEVQMALVRSPDDPIAADRAVLPLERHHEKLTLLIERCRRVARTPKSPSLVSMK